MSYTVGSAFLQIVPSFQGVVDAIEAEMEKDGEIAGNVFKEAFQEATRGLSATVNLNDDEALAKVAELKVAEDSLSDKTISIGADDSSFRTLQDDARSLATAAASAGIEFEQLRTTMESSGVTLSDFGQEADRLGVSTDDLGLSLANLVSRGDNLKSFWSEMESGAVSWDAGIKLAARDAAEAALDAEVLSGTADRTSTALTNMGGAGRGAGSGLTSAASGAEGFSLGMPSLIQLAIGGAPALVALGGAAIGVGGALAGAALAGTGALLPFIAAAAGDLKALHPQITQIEDDWKGWSASFQPVVTSSLVPWLNAVVPGLASLSPLVPMVGGEIRTLGDDFDSTVGSPGWIQFVDWVGNEGPPSIDAFVKGLGSIGEAIVNMGETGAPVITMVDDGWRSLTSDLDNFSQSNTFRGFISWLQQNLPTIGHDLEDVGEDAGHLLSGLGEIGTPLLTLFTSIANLARSVTGGVVGNLEDIGHGLSDVFGEGTSGLQKMVAAEANQATNLAAIILGTKQVSAAQEQAALSGMSLANVVIAHQEAMAAETKGVTDGMTAFGDIADGVYKTFADDLDSWNAKGNADIVTLKGMKDAVTGLGTSAQSSFLNASSIVSAFSGKLSVTGSQISNFYSTSVAGAQTFTADIQKAIQDGYNPQLIAQLLQAGPAQAGPILTSLVANASGSFVQEVNASSAALSKIGQYEIDQASLTQRAIDTNNAQTKADYSTAMEVLAQISADGGSATVDQLATQLGLAPARIEQIVGEYQATFGGGMVSLEGQGTTGGSTTAANVAQALAAPVALTAISSSMNQVVGAVTGVLGGLFGDGKTAGSQLGQGITAGIAQQAEAVMAEAGHLVSQALGSIAAALGNPHSPAPATIPLGLSIPQGVEAGMLLGLGAVAGAGESLIAAALGPLGASGVPGLAVSGSGTASEAAANTQAIAPLAATAAIRVTPTVVVPASRSFNVGDINVYGAGSDAQATALAVRSEIERAFQQLNDEYDANAVGYS